MKSLAFETRPQCSEKSSVIQVGSSFYCARRAVLDERMKSNDVVYPALMGTMLHQLFQV